MALLVSTSVQRSEKSGKDSNKEDWVLNQTVKFCFDEIIIIRFWSSKGSNIVCIISR